MRYIGYDGTMSRTCIECSADLPAPWRPDRRFCGSRCRVRAHRRRKAVRAIPECMRSERRWVRADGKRPIRPDGQWASSTKSWTWRDFDEVERGEGDGFGFMLGGGIGCVDLDHSIGADGEIKPWAQRIVDEYASRTVFAERSVSGTGAHLFVRLAESRGQKVEIEDGRAEFYSWGRFIRMTGAAI